MLLFTATAFQRAIVGDLPCSAQPPVLMAGGWPLGPSSALPGGLFLKSCSYLAMPYHVCVPDLGIPQQPSQGPLRSPRQLSEARASEALGHTLPSSRLSSQASGVWNLPILFMEMDGHRLQPCSQCWPWYPQQQQPPAKILTTANLCGALLSTIFQAV